jgi:glycosyltransferase involved in cell wall biosynthesis
MKRHRLNKKEVIRKKIELRHSKLIFIEKGQKDQEVVLKKTAVITNKPMKERDYLRIYGKPNIHRLIENALDLSEKKIPISIIITAYQTQNFIEECLDSIENQTYFNNNNNYEVLVGIDGCQETLEKVKQIAHKYRNLSVYMMESNKGTYITTNTLLDLVKYDNILRFDSDDVMMPEMINEIMNQANDFDIIKFGFYDFTNNINNVSRNSMPVALGAIFAKKSIFEKAGGYQPWICSADREFLLRMKKHAMFGTIEKPIFYRRVHSGSLAKRIDIKTRNKIRREYNGLIVHYQNVENIKINKIVNKYTTIKLTTEIDLSNCGIMLISFGIDYDSIAPFCASSIREFSSLPILVHTNLPDFVRNEKWNNISNVEFVFHNLQDDDNRIIKTQLSKHTKFKKTLYIDIDSKVLSKDFIKPFSYLHEFDIVSPAWKTYKIEEIQKLAINHNKFKKFFKICQMFNIEKETFIGGGVCYFNKNEKTDLFFDTFHKLWKETGGIEDMPGLNGAYFSNKNIVKLLNNKEYNNYNSLIIMSYHDASKKYENLENFIRKRYDDKTDNWMFCKQGENFHFKKPRVCFIYDVMNWAFYIMSFNIKKYLNIYYDIDIIRYDMLLNDNDYDCIIAFSPKVLPIINSKKIICGISSMKSEKNIILLENFEFVFANNIDLFNKIKNKNKYYLMNGVNIDFYKKENIKKNDSLFRIGFVGSKKWENHKGVSRIVEICQNDLIKNNIINSSLIIDTNHDKILSQSEMKKYYNSIDVFIISSISETGPNTLLESMACGIPVIANDVGLVSLIIKNNINGFIVDNYANINSYVSCIKKLIDDKELYKNMSLNASKDIQKWGWNDMSKGFKKMIDDFLIKK